MMGRSSLVILMALAAFGSVRATLNLQVTCTTSSPFGVQLQTGAPLSSICSDSLNVVITNTLPQEVTGVTITPYWSPACMNDVMMNVGIPFQRFSGGQAVTGLQPGESRSLDLSAAQVDAIPDCSPGCLLFVLETDGAPANAPMPALYGLEMEQAESTCGTMGIDATLEVVTVSGDANVAADWTLQQNGDVYEAPLSDILTSVSLAVQGKDLKARIIPWSMIAFVRKSDWGISLPIPDQSGNVQCVVPFLSLDDLDLGTLTTASVTAGSNWTEDANLANRKLKMKVGECPICGAADLIVAFDPFSETYDATPCDNFKVIKVNIICPQNISTWNGTALQPFPDGLTFGNQLYVKRCVGHAQPDVFRNGFFGQQWTKLNKSEEMIVWTEIKRQKVFGDRLVDEGKATAPDYCSQVIGTLTVAEFPPGMAPLPVPPAAGCTTAMQGLRDIRMNNSLPTEAQVLSAKSACSGSQLISEILDEHLKIIQNGGTPTKAMLNQLFNVTAEECPTDPGIFLGRPNPQFLLKPLHRLIARSGSLWSMAAGGDCVPAPDDCGMLAFGSAMQAPIRLAIFRDIRASKQQMMSTANAKAAVREIMRNLEMPEADLSYIDNCPVPDPTRSALIPAVFYRSNNGVIQMSMRNLYEQGDKQYCFTDCVIPSCSQCTGNPSQ